jgi:rubrerythrin
MSRILLATFLLAVSVSPCAFAQTADSDLMRQVIEAGLQKLMKGMQEGDSPSRQQPDVESQQAVQDDDLSRANSADNYNQDSNWRLMEDDRRRSEAHQKDEAELQDRHTRQQEESYQQDAARQQEEQQARAARQQEDDLRQEREADQRAEALQDQNNYWNCTGFGCGSDGGSSSGGSWGGGESNSGSSWSGGGESSSSGSSGWGSSGSSE